MVRFSLIILKPFATGPPCAIGSMYEVDSPLVAQQSRGRQRFLMAPGEGLNAESVARAVAALPAALFVGDVSGPLNAEAIVLAEKLDPKLEEIKADMDATLELCHPGNEPSAGRWKDNVDAVRTSVRSIQAMATSLLNGTYVTPTARERLHRQASLSSMTRAQNAHSIAEKGSLPPDQELVLEL